nr:hypothetical protein [Tanacetum cinerariifolium]
EESIQIGRKNLKSQQKFQDIDDLVDEEVIVKDKVTTATPKTPPTTTLFDDEDVTIADTLVKMKSQKAKGKGVTFKDVNDSAKPIRSITTLQPLPTIDLKDKGKGIIQEPEPMKKTKKMDQDQIKRDAEVALKIQADLDEEVRTERERQEEASKASITELYYDVQSQIDVDHELAARLTYEEQENYTVEERSKLLVEFFERRKKQLAKERAEEIRSKPPTKAQLRSLMMTYLKYTVSDKELRKWLKVVPDDDKAKSLIVDYESQELETMEAGGVHVYKLTRLEGSYKHFLTFSKMLEVIDRQDLLDLHKIIMERFLANDPEDDSVVSINMFIEKRLMKSKVFGYILLVIMKLILKKLDFHQVKIKFTGELLGFMPFRLSTVSYR